MSAALGNVSMSTRDVKIIGEETIADPRLPI